MKNNNIINAWNEVLPDGETKERMFGNIQKEYRQHKKFSIFKPTKILATAAAIILIAGLMNIQTVIAFIGSLLFVPGAGVTQGVSVTNYGLDEPVDIETEYGLMTLKIANKTTKNGRSDLWFYIYSNEINAPKARNGEYPLIVSIVANKEAILSDAELLAAASWGSDGTNEVTYGYLCENFPDVNEFDLIFENLGVETRVVLSYQPNNFAFSKENNGITLAASKFNGLSDMIAQDIYDSSENAEDYNIFGSAMIHSLRFYGEDGEEIRWTSGWGGFDPDSPLNYQITEFYKNEKEIKSLKADQLRLNYNKYGKGPSSAKKPSAIEIPMPKDGETIQVNIEIPIGSHTFRITEVRREGDTVYYESNATHGIPTAWDDPEAYEKAVKNTESFIEFIDFCPVSDLYVPAEQLAEMFGGAFPKMCGGCIWDFDENAESLTFYFVHASIIQFGDFDIEFD